MRMKKRHMYTAPPGWATLLWILYAASVLILVRSVFRLIEYGGGRDGYLMRKEVVSSSHNPNIAELMHASLSIVSVRFRRSPHVWRDGGVQCGSPRERIDTLE